MFYFVLVRIISCAQYGKPVGYNSLRVLDFPVELYIL